MRAGTDAYPPIDADGFHLHHDLSHPDGSEFLDFMTCRSKLTNDDAFMGGG
jgi:hypothetical protein